MREEGGGRSDSVVSSHSACAHFFLTEITPVAHHRGQFELFF